MIVPIYVIVLIALVNRTKKLLPAYRAIFPEASVPKALFHEFGASARNMRTTITQFSGASKCLEIVVTDAELHIKLQWPIIIGLMPTNGNLIHRLPKREVQILPNSEGQASSRVQLQFTDRKGEEQVLDLILKNPDAFVNAMLHAS